MDDKRRSSRRPDSPDLPQPWRRYAEGAARRHPWDAYAAQERGGLYLEAPLERRRDALKFACDAGYKEVVFAPTSPRECAVRVVRTRWGDNESVLEPPPGPWSKSASWRRWPGAWSPELLEFPLLIRLATSGECSEEERQAALQQLGSRWFPNPIHPLRWPSVEESVRATVEGLKARGTSLTNVVVMALERVIPRDAWDRDFWSLRKEVSSRLNRLVTEWLAGPDWRGQSRQRKQEKEALEAFVQPRPGPTPSPEQEALTPSPEQDLARLRGRARLTAEQEAVIEAYLQTDGNIAAAARLLGKPAPTVKTHFYRALRKLKKAGEAV